MTPEAWRTTAADTVVQLAQIRWTLGDLINQAPNTPALAELLNSNETLEPGETSLMAATAQAFPPHRRRPNLPWNVHAATVALPAEQADLILDAAEENPTSLQSVRRAVTSATKPATS
jgi:hypothetical protein